MVFSSITFLVYFLPIFLVLYYLCPRAIRNYFILFSSLCFYSWGAPTFAFILVGSTIIDFYIVKALAAAKAQHIKKRWLLTSILMNVGLLVYFKYANFFVENFNAALTGIGMENVEWTKIALPIGISFYTFQTLTYSIDVFRGTSEPLKKLTNYLLYITLFPQMIAGPIVRYNSIAKQITDRVETWDERLYGLYRFGIGLGKKVLIANVLGGYASDVMGANVAWIDTPAAWLAVLAYGMQIYFDFSGYSDMAIGIGKMMGFTFPENFNNPYVARSVTDFWRRWHITLGTWMRDYLYIPLGGSRSTSLARIYMNLWIVFLISGFWHGASWNFVVWGAFHGFFLVIERLFLGKLLKKLGGFVSIIYTFVMVMISWAIFAIEDISVLGKYLKKMFWLAPPSGKFIEPLPGFYGILIIALLFSFITLLPQGQKLHDRIFSDKLQLSGSIIAAVGTLLLLCLSIAYITSSDFNPFIYFRF
jgi:alginate O-acetyltransferase complex protein AlgI